MRKPLAIHSPFDDRAWEYVPDGSRPIAGVEVAHRRVGVKDWRAELGEHGRDGRFPHCYRARQADDDHRLASCAARRSASIRARRASVTSGRRPNHRSNAGIAWRSSVESPSAACKPRACADFAGDVLEGNVDDVGHHRGSR